MRFPLCAPITTFNRCHNYDNLPDVEVQKHPRHQRSFMGKYLNFILAILILVIVTAVCSTFFYKKGQESAWQLSKQLIPLNKGDLYLCVEKTDGNGVSYLTVQEISEATTNRNVNQKELRFRLNLARDGMSLQEYNNRYRGGKQGF